MKKVPYILLAAALILSAALSFAPTESQAATCIRLTRDLERGMKGNDVLQVQSFLVERGFLSSASFQAGAGQYGPLTVTSVRAFQTSAGISATGYIGPVTRQALTNATCGSTTASTAGGGSGSSQNGQSGLGTPVVIGGAHTGLSISLRTERANNTFSQVDSIRMYVTVHNASPSAFPLTFPTTCQASYIIGTAFNFGDWRTCQQAPSTITVAANGGSYTWELTYTPITFGQLAVGTKTLRATVGNYGSDELSLTITPIQQGQQAPVVIPQGTETPTTPTNPTIGGGPVIPEQATPVTIGGSPTGLTILTQTDRANNTFRQTDTIRLKVTVRNSNTTSYKLNFSTTCQASYTISPTFNINDWRSCPPSSASRTIPAGGSYTWDLVYYPSTLGQLSIGTKTLRGIVGNYGGDNLTLTVTPFQTTEGPVTVSPNNTTTNTQTSPTGSVPHGQDQGQGPQESGPTGTSFPIFDDIAGYVGEPNPTFLPGLTEMCGSYTYSFFPQNNTNIPSEQITRNTVRNLPPTCKYFIIDIEHLPYDIRHDTYPYSQVNATIQKFNSIITWIRSERPDLKIGFYGVIPVPVYWEIQNYVGSLQSNEPWWVAQRPAFLAEYQKWQQANNYLASLASKVDFIGPTLYDPYPNSIAGWRNLTEKTIQEANRYNKPVYPFVWFRINNVEHGYAMISPSQMRQQFEGVKQYGADGMIIWDYGHGVPWPNFNWIPELQNFINANNINPSLPASAIDAVGGRSATTAAYILAGGVTLIFLSLVLLGLTVFKRSIRRGR